MSYNQERGWIINLKDILENLQMSKTDVGKKMKTGNVKEYLISY